MILVYRILLKKLLLISLAHERSLTRNGEESRICIKNFVSSLNSKKQAGIVPLERL